MEAIAELFAALLMGLFELLLLPVQLAAELLGYGLEALIHGRLAAQEKRQQRRDELAKKVAESPVPAVLTPEERRRRTIRVTIVMGVGLFGFAGYHWISSRIREQRQIATRIQIAKLADNFIQQAGQPNANLPEGVLPDHDAWSHPCELFVDKWMVGTLIVVRSAGPDSRTGTIDDMLSVRFARPRLNVLGIDLGKIGVDAVKKRLLHILPGLPDDPLPAQVDIQVQ